MGQEQKENRLFRILKHNFWKLIGLNLVYLICCIPIVTVGPATAGLVYVLKEVEAERIVFVIRDFFEGVKKNWKQALPVGVAHAAAVAASGWAVWYYAVWLSQSREQMILMAIGLSLAVMVSVILTFSGPYLYLQIVNCRLSVAQILKNAVLLGLARLQDSFLVLLAGGAFAILLLSPTLFISVYFYPISLVLFALCGAAFPCLYAVYRLQKNVLRYCVSEQQNGIQ